MDNTCVIIWILNSITKEIAMGLWPFKLAFEIWNRLQKIYTQLNHARDFQPEHILSKYK